MTESEHFCYDCAFKHISMARILWNEVQNGWNNTDHMSYIVGNLALAEIHIFELHPHIADVIRNGRKAFWDGVLTGDTVRPDFESMLEGVYEAATAIPDIEDILAEDVTKKDLLSSLGIDEDVERARMLEEDNTYPGEPKEDNRYPGEPKINPHLGEVDPQLLADYKKRQEEAANG